MIGTEYFRVEQAGEIAIVRIVDTWSFDIEDYAQLRHDLADLIEQHRPKKLLVDLSNIEACSTALTSALLMAQKHMQPWAGVMKLVGLSEVVQENFIVKQFGDVTVIQIVDTQYFDTDNYAQLQEDLAYFVARQQPRELLVDLSNIVFCSTALIAALLMALKCLQTGPGVMRLVGLSEDVLESLQHLKLVGAVFSVCTDDETAA